MNDYLGISLEKLLELDILNGSKVLAGHGGLANRISKVNVMEVPDIIDWVSKGEFLLTIAYSIRNNIEVLQELIPKLKEKGVSGIGIKVGRYINELPVDIIELANSINFPIIEVPFNVSHTDIISAILTEVINDQTNMMVAIEKFNREIMNVMIEGGKFREITEKLHDNIQNTIAIYESMSDQYEIVSNKEEYIEKYTEVINNYIKTKNENEVSVINDYDIINKTKIKKIIIPIVIENIEHGYIFIWSDNKELSQIDMMFIESYSHIISLEFVKKLSLYNVERNYKIEFFNDLLSSNKSNQKRASEKLKIFNFNKKNKYCVIVILLRDLLQNNGEGVLIKNAQLEMSRLLFIINRLTKVNSKLLFVEKNDRFILLCGSNEGASTLGAKNVALDICQRILLEATKNFDKERIVAGVGRHYLDISQLWKSYQQSKLIVENLSKNSSKSIIHYDDLGLYRILAYDGLEGELKDFCKDTIVPLIKYDKENNTEFVKTLEEYFKYNGNVKKISGNMYLHYNTIVYRLQKIKDITGMDIEESDNRLNLQIALKILNVMNLNVID